jgi:hypothetical protein
MDEQRDQLRKLVPAPAVPNSDPAPRTLQRAQTWAPDADIAMSDALTGEEVKTKAASKKKVGKELTRARLENAIATGQMPPFCDNCGAIETPAWRRAFVKTFESGWDEMETSLGQGECCFKEPIDYNPDGTVKTFRGYKVDKKQGDGEDWEAVQLCNRESSDWTTRLMLLTFAACGLWFHKQKCPRPPTKWQKKDPNAKRKRKRNPPKSRGKGTGEFQPKTDEPSPASDDSSPGDSEAPDAEDNDNDGQPNANSNAEQDEPELPPVPRSLRASSAEPNSRGLPRTRQQAAGRQTQSSPLRCPGSENIPIEIDLTPKPVRRQLFPSPVTARLASDPGLGAAPAVSESLLPSFVRRSPRLNKTKDVFAQSSIHTEAAVGKENVMPTPAPADDGLAHLFEEGHDVELPPPMTPTPKRRSERILLKTPSKTPQRQFGAQVSPNIDNTSFLKTPKARQVPHPAITALLGSAQKNVLEMTPISRHIHDVLTSDLPVNMEFSEGIEQAVRKTPVKQSITFNFPDLPSLKGSSPMVEGQLTNFPYSELTTDQLTSDMVDPFAHAAMPSSPPAGLFDFFNDSAMDESANAMWDKLMNPDAIETTGPSSYPDPESLTVGDMAMHAVRRSPRRPKAT